MIFRCPCLPLLSTWLRLQSGPKGLPLPGWVRVKTPEGMDERQNYEGPGTSACGENAAHREALA